MQIFWSVAGFENSYRFTNGFLGLLAIAGLEKLRREWLMRKIRTVDKDLFPNHWLLGGAFDAPDPNVPGLNLKISHDRTLVDHILIFGKRRASSMGITIVTRHKRKISKRINF